MDTKKLDKNELENFIGTTTWWRHPLMKTITYTDGVKHLAEKGGAYWLIDEIATNQLLAVIRKESFQTWKLQVKPNNSAILRCEDGDGRVVWKKEIEYTDFPLEEITVWMTGGVIMLPSEY